MNNNNTTDSQLFTAMDQLEKINNCIDSFAKQILDLKTNFDINILDNFKENLKSTKIEYLKMKEEINLHKNAVSEVSNCYYFYMELNFKFFNSTIDKQYL